MYVCRPRATSPSAGLAASARATTPKKVCATPARRTNATTKTRKHEEDPLYLVFFFMAVCFRGCIALLPRLRDDVDECRLAFLHDHERALQRGREIGRLLDRPLGMDAEALRHLRVIDIGVGDRRPDVRTVDAAIVAVGPDVAVPPT